MVFRELLQFTNSGSLKSFRGWTWYFQFTFAVSPSSQNLKPCQLYVHSYRFSSYVFGWKFEDLWVVMLLLNMSFVAMMIIHCDSWLVATCLALLTFTECGGDVVFLWTTICITIDVFQLNVLAWQRPSLSKLFYVIYVPLSCSFLFTWWLQNFPCQEVERHNKPEVELKYVYSFQFH